MTATDYIQQTKTHPKYHLYGILHQQSAYIRQLQAVRANDAWSSLSTALKGTILAALWMGKCHNVVADILEKEACGIAELSKMLSLLDKPRQIRQLRSRIQKIELQQPHVIQSSSGEGSKSDKKRKLKSEHKNKGSEKRQRPRKVDQHRRDLRALEATQENHQPHEKNEAWCQDSAVQELYDSASVSGALARHLRKWARTLTPDFLEFVMLEIEDKAHWRFVADLVHFSPKDFSLPYFLADVHGDSIPDDCFVSAMRKLLAFESNDEQEFADMFVDVANKFPQIRLSYPSLCLKPAIVQNPKIVENLARHIPLETVIWYFEEMYQTNKTCASILKSRLEEPGALEQALASGAKVYSFGKLMERILMLQKMKQRAKFQKVSSAENDLADLVIPIAKRKLSALREKWSSQSRNSNKKLAVLGDASSSMQCAIDAATIFAGFLSALLDGELIFFNHEAVHSPHKKPSTVPQVLDICHKIRASGGTSLASALGYYFQRKIWLDAVVLVTDEEENTAWSGRLFAKLFQEYQATVNPEVKLVVVCVGCGDRAFRSSLAQYGIEHNTVHIDNARPDLTKFDALIGDIAYNCMGLTLEGGGGKDDTPVEDDSTKDVEMDTCGEAVVAGDDFVVID